MPNLWARDAGLRVKFLLLNSVCVPAFVAGDVARWVRGGPDASDYAPVWIEFKS